MTSNAKTIAEYLEELPEDRRETIAVLRRTIVDSLQPGFEEGMQYGAIGYYVPHSIYPAGYHCDPKQPLPFAGIGNQKNHIGIYLFCVYTNEEVQKWFIESWKSSGKKLDMGKSCVRVKNLDAVPLDVVAELFKRISVDDFVASYEAAKKTWTKSK